MTLDKIKSDYLRLKSNTLKVSTHDIELIDSDIVKVYYNSKWHFVPLSTAAFSDLLNLYSMSNKFYKDVERIGQKKALELVMKLMSHVKLANSELVLLYNSYTKNVQRIFASNKLKNISTDMYFDTVEQMLSKEGMEFERGNATVDGISIALISNKEISHSRFNANETFNFGFTLDMGINHITSSFFNKRLVCKNGMKVTNTMGNVKFGQNQDAFFRFVDNIENSDTFKEVFFKQVGNCIDSTASVREMEIAIASVKRNSDLEYNDIVSMFGMDRVYGEYEKYGNNLDAIESNVKRLAPTDIVLWDAINSMTDFASNGIGHGMDDVKRFNIMTDAGMLMSKQNDLTTNSIKIPPMFVK